MAESERILLVEDEESMAVGLEYNLEAEGYEVLWVSDGREALKRIQSQAFDLIILDIMLPYINGFEVAEHIRTNDPKMPILMLTARTDAKDRIHGLKIGADDYLTKPFHLDELLLRVSGMLKRKHWYIESSEKMPVFRFGRNEVNFDNLTAKANNQSIQLTVHEAMLLKYLIERRGNVVSRKELLEHVWRIHSDVETRTVDNFIVRLRKYFESNPDKPTYIKSVRGVGYRFDP